MKIIKQIILSLIVLSASSEAVQAVKIPQAISVVAKAGMMAVGFLIFSATPTQTQTSPTTCSLALVNNKINITNGVTSLLEIEQYQDGDDFKNGFLIATHKSSGEKFFLNLSSREIGRVVSGTETFNRFSKPQYILDSSIVLPEPKKVLQIADRPFVALQTEIAEEVDDEPMPSLESPVAITETVAAEPQQSQEGKIKLDLKVLAGGAVALVAYKYGNKILSNAYNIAKGTACCVVALGVLKVIRPSSLEHKIALGAGTAFLTSYAIDNRSAACKTAILSKFNARV